jgi:hypothetical protein
MGCSATRRVSSVTEIYKTSRKEDKAGTKKIEEETLSQKRRDWKVFVHRPVYNINDATFTHKPIRT